MKFEQHEDEALSRLAATVSKTAAVRTVRPAAAAAATATTKPIRHAQECRICTLHEHRSVPHDPKRFHADTNETELALSRGSARRAVVNRLATVA